MDHRYHFGFQMCVVGEQSVGKTALLQSAIANKVTTTLVGRHEEQYLRIMFSSGGTRFRIDIHEISEVTFLCQSAAVIVLVINAGDPKSVRNIPWWLNQLGKNVDAGRVVVVVNRATSEAKAEIQSLVGHVPTTFVETLAKATLLEDVCDLIEERIPMPLDAAGMLRTKVSLGPDVLRDLEDVCGTLLDADQNVD
eukprot:GEMP01090427.1.p1 GENE.GEMP01090427.1~~GEMP01090427.1.p1  ORF type:complete len:195 (+),score=52.64 GEMP01090427.1:257-841(+)